MVPPNDDSVFLHGGETQTSDRKSLRKVTGNTADFVDLARSCVCFANAAGGQLLIGIEDDATQPPPQQRIDPYLLDHIRKRIRELTVNVNALPEIRTDTNGGEYIVLTIARSRGVSSTSDGRYFIRIGDTCRAIVGDEVMRLADERPDVPWEAMTSRRLPYSATDTAKRSAWIAAIRFSERVHHSVKEKTDEELLDHYGLSANGLLTNLGILLLGTAADRARLGTAPMVQAIKYDGHGTKVAKHVWDDYHLSPLEIIDAVWREIPDFRESYELPNGMIRTNVPAYDEAVVRELLVNVLVHRPYTHRGDIFLNLHPDHLEIVNPGRLPLGVTPHNILHTSRRRNDGLARIFYDLQLMEREGSGIDLIYDRLLTSGRAAPVVTEGVDSVHVVVPRRVVHANVIRLITEMDQRYQLSQRERIALGILGQTEGRSAAELIRTLELADAAALRPWIARLIDLGIIEQSGRTSATRYFVSSHLLRNVGLDTQTTLTRIEPHRLKALILEDLERFPNSGRVDIHRRIGREIHPKTITRTLNSLLERGDILASGDRRWRTYRLAPAHGQQS